jgi:hypothetical protein
VRKVFVSYARANKPDIEQLSSHLNELGWNPWVDTSLHGGQEWWEEILRQIEDCDIFIPIISGDALKSEACEREFDWAEALGKRVLPVAVEPMPAVLPRRYARRHIVNYSNRDNRDRAAIQLSRALSNLESTPAPPAPRPRPRPPEAPMSYLTDLIELVGSRVVLSHTQQRDVLFSLEAALKSDDSREKEGGRDVLQRFSQRADLYADVHKRIVTLKQFSYPRPPQPPPKREPKPPPPPNPTFRQSITAIPATFFAAAAVANAIPPARTLSTHYGYQDIDVWYWQTAARILIGVAFCLLAWIARSSPNRTVLFSGLLIGALTFLYVINDIAVIEGLRSYDVSEFRRVIVYPVLLGVMSLVVVIFGAAVNRTERCAWASILGVWGVCGLIEAFLSFVAKKDTHIPKINEFSAPVADSVLIVQNLILLIVAIAMYAGAHPVKRAAPASR